MIPHDIVLKFCFFRLSKQLINLSVCCERLIVYWSETMILYVLCFGAQNVQKWCCLISALKSNSNTENIQTCHEDKNNIRLFYIVL